jgi:hypothetical protein
MGLPLILTEISWLFFDFFVMGLWVWNRTSRPAYFISFYARRSQYVLGINACQYKRVTSTIGHSPQHPNVLATPNLQCNWHDPNSTPLYISMMITIERFQACLMCKPSLPSLHCPVYTTKLPDSPQGPGRCSILPPRCGHRPGSCQTLWRALRALQATGWGICCQQRRVRYTFS